MASAAGEQRVQLLVALHHPALHAAGHHRVTTLDTGADADAGQPASAAIEGLQVHNAYRCLSLDEPLGTETSDESTHAGALGELDRGVALVEDWETLGPLLDALAERERRIVLLRFFGNMTQTQIAQEIGISQMHVSRLLAATLKELRQALSADT